MARILIVDSNAATRELIAHALTSAGHSTKAIVSSEDLVALVASGYDVAVTAIDLSTPTGVRFREAADRANTPILAFTAPSSAKQALRAGAYDTVAQPLTDHQVLLAAVVRAKAHRTLQQEVSRLRAALGETAASTANGAATNGANGNGDHKLNGGANTETISLQARTPSEMPTLETLERHYVGQVLQATAGNKTQAARVLGVDRRTLYRKLDRWAAAGETVGNGLN